MSTNDEPTSTGGNMTRKQRRAADRAGRKNGGGKSPNSASGGGSGPSMLVISAAAIAIGLVAVIALVLVSGGLGGSSSDAAAVSEPDTPAPAEALRSGRTLGAPGAAVAIEVFEDPQCPACGAFTKRIEPLLVGSFVTDGTATLTYNDFVFLGDESWDGAIAMRVAEDMDGKFWDYHHILFHNQSGENKGAFSRDRLAEMAEIIGLDRDEFLSKMDDPAYRTAVEAENQKGRDLTVSSTPTIIVNGELIRGVPNWDDFSAVIEAAASDTVAEGS